MKFSKILIILFFATLVCADSDVRYTIVAPKFLHSSRQYQISVDFENIHAPIDVHAIINGSHFNANKSLEINESGLSNLVFDLPALNEDKYELNIEAEGALSFRVAKTLELAKFKPIVAIQIERENYFDDPTPHVYTFFALFFNENLQPLKQAPNNTEILVYDAAQNVKWKYQNLHLKNGRYFGSFELLRNFNYNLGHWRLEVLIDHEVVRTTNFVLGASRKYRLKSRGNSETPLANKLEQVLSSENGLQINIENMNDSQSFEVNEKLLVTISSELPYSYFVYQLTGRGKILKSSRKVFAELQRKSNFELIAEHAMAPHFRLIVHFIDNNGEIHFAEKIIQVKPAFENVLECDLGKTENTLSNKSKATVDTISYETAPKDYEIDTDELLQRLGGFDLKAGELTATVTFSNAANFEQIKQKSSQVNLTLNSETALKQISAKTKLRWTHPSPLAGFNATASNALCLVVGNETGFESYNKSNELMINSNMPKLFQLTANEIIRIRLNIQNNATVEQKVKVTLKQTHDFEVVNNALNGVTRNLRLSAQNSSDLDFYLRPKRRGAISIDFEIYASVKEIFKVNLLIKSNKHMQGIEKYKFLYDIASNYFDIWRPKNMVPQTEKFTVTFFEGLLRPLLENYRKFQVHSSLNTEKAINRLYLWHEFSKFAELKSFFVLLRYELDSPLQTLLSNWNVEVGALRNFLTDRNFDKTSSWLTAYALGVLPDISKEFPKKQIPTFNIDEVVEKSLEFLAKAQRADGSFEAERPLLNERYQNAYAITAQSLQAFLKNSHSKKVTRTHIDKAATYLFVNFEGQADLFGKSLALNALNKAGYSKFAQLELDALKGSNLSNIGENLMWWTNDFHDADVEITALMLLNILEIEQWTDTSAEAVLPIIKWLIEVGGIYKESVAFPTRAHIIAAKAFHKYQQLAKDQFATQKFEIESSSLYAEDSSQLRDEQQNAGFALHEFVLQKDTDSFIGFVSTSNSRKPLAVARLKSEFELTTPLGTQLPSFGVKATVLDDSKTTPLQYFSLQICGAYTGANDRAKMSIASIALPTGYKADFESLNKLRFYMFVEAFYTEEGDSVINVFMSGLKLMERFCFYIDARRAYPVALQAKASVEIYEYDEYEQRGITFYEIPTNVADVCDAVAKCNWPDFQEEEIKN